MLCNLEDVKCLLYVDNINPSNRRQSQRKGLMFNIRGCGDFPRDTAKHFPVCHSQLDYK